MSTPPRLRKSDLGAFLAIATFSMAVVFGPMAARGSLYWDALGQYSFFYDNLDSLNRFAEPAWWSPQIWYGTPTYFYALLGIPNLGKPVFATLGLVVWVLGRLGIELPSVLPIYLLYLSVLLPLMFLIGVLLVARQTLRSRTAVLYTLVVASFSPAIMTGLSDPGILEYTAYTLYCAAAFLHFVGRPSPRSFALLCLALALITLGLSHSVVATALPALPMLLVASALTSRPARAALWQIPWTHLCAAGVLLLATSSPILLAYAQQKGKVVHEEFGVLEYPFANIKAGNPLEFLLASTPGITFQWDRYVQESGSPPAELRLQPLRWHEDAGHAYLGLLAVPLAGVGLVYGRRRLRLPLSLMLGFGSMVVLLTAYSPFFAPLLAVAAPLRSYNHFSDVFYSGVGFLPLLFAAGLGLEAVERQPLALRRFVALFGVTSVASLFLQIGLGQRQQSLLGFNAVLIASFAIVLVSACRLATPGARSRRLARGLFVLTLVDVSTFAFWYLRLTVHESEARGTPREVHGMIGLRGEGTNVARTFMLRDSRAVIRAGMPLEGLPSVAGFCSAHTYEHLPTTPDLTLLLGESPGQRSLAFRSELAGAAALQPFLGAAPGASCESRTRVAARTYNMLRVHVVAREPQLLFVRSAHSPGWKATVNGVRAPILPALGAFMAIPVPAGSSDVRLRFSPPLLPLALLGSYAILLALGLAVWRLPGYYGRGPRG